MRPRQRGIVWIGAGLTLLFVGITFIGFARYVREDPAPRIAAFVIGSVSISVAYRSIYRGRRWLAEAAATSIARNGDAAAPTFLYLRSFQDEYVSLGASGVGQTNMFGKSIVGWQQLAVESRAEEVLVSLLKPAGDVVSLTDPRELLPHPGAKAERTGEQWEGRFRQLARSVRAVVVLVGSISPGLCRELSYLAESLPPTRLVLFLPYAEEARDDAYAHFRHTAPADFAEHLPDTARQALFIIFGDDWTPDFVGSGLGFEPAVKYILRVVPRSPHDE